jgi:dTMP kinase
MKKGNFIAFEGLDGSGKTTQLYAIRDKLLKRNIKCREETEPSSGILGLMARGGIKKTVSITPHALALVFAADRHDHILNDIKPYIDTGIHVLCDRFILSSFAYQGLTHSFTELLSFNERAIDILLPTLTIFIDTDPEDCLKRIGKTRIGKELFDEKGVPVRKNFLNAIDTFKDSMNILTVDGNQPEEVVTDEIWKLIEPLFITKE